MDVVGVGFEVGCEGGEGGGRMPGAGDEDDGWSGCHGVQVVMGGFEGDGWCCGFLW